MLEGIVRLMEYGISSRLKNDRVARRWMRRMNRIVVFDMGEEGAITMQFVRGRARIRKGRAGKAHLVIAGPMEDLVGYVNGEVGSSELLGKIATGEVQVNIRVWPTPQDIMNFLKLDEIFVIARKQEGFPLSLVDASRRALLLVQRFCDHLPLVGSGA